ncbi:methylated-DNA--[protein]-cysteine S-methyltransferase [Companilactobacillus allii]|uniref:methylated-DNA--[protein]-cysteine S-methyltransferase n=1 Tax=Companilactobacillus allii TaxID=1847728 RepID=A0A1P8Q4P9_9LACO|nr:methylated-DNA--[protein]-cysteine S-methyltransferase [Companilactobacillus allii]APX72834.1 hypothetical protein BTM29_09855 [Companilactobacillus allii]USQ67621.1 methylated-DNA--[protein]-cysteine S-methyltransferase [Companilactobacillus allii]
MNKTIYYQKIIIKDHSYMIGATKNGLSFVGSRDSNLTELISFYPNTKIIEDEDICSEYSKQLSEYLSGERTKFDLKLDLVGTKFQRIVWREVKSIDYGHICSYTDIANNIGNPKAVRAIGTAVGRNPVLMVIPCHRVLTKDGKLGGYRGGLNMKRDLLELERCEVNNGKI